MFLNYYLYRSSLLSRTTRRIAHADHIVGLAVLRQAFPNARESRCPRREGGEDGLAGAPEVLVLHLWQQIPGPEPVVLKELTTPVLTLEGEQFPITGPVQGAMDPVTALYLSLAESRRHGDIVFDHVYFGVPRGKAREDWSKTIDRITALKPAIIVPGHEGPGATRDMRSIQFMKKYIADWMQT